MAPAWTAREISRNQQAEAAEAPLRAAEAFTRVDHVWKAEHPGLPHLEASRCLEETTVWCLDSNEYSGVNDRYFIMERSGARVLEGFVDTLKSFQKLDAVNRFARARTPLAASAPLNYERFLLQAFRHAGLCIRYMTSVSGHAVWPERLSFAFAEVWHQGGVCRSSALSPEPQALISIFQERTCYQHARQEAGGR